MGVNAIEWGNKFSKDLIVKVNYEITERYFRIIVEDEGSGFNFRKYLNGEYKGIEHQEERIDQGKRLGGFGISMAKLYFDEVKYNDTGNIVQLIKRLK
jgi:anti-sigma regulatory factor (Ser/Thr protein kinase)